MFSDSNVYVYEHYVRFMHVNILVVFLDVALCYSMSGSSNLDGFRDGWLVAVKIGTHEDAANYALTG